MHRHSKMTVIDKLRGLTRWTIRVFAALFLLQLALAVTGLPRGLTDWLNGQDSRPQQPPSTIVVLGGGGMPSDSTLIRLYYAAQLGQGLTGVTYIVALPAGNDAEHESVGRMRDELVLRGVPASAVRMETRGRNTHEQAVNVRALGVAEPVAVVSSGYHVRRAVLAFRAAGFGNVVGYNAGNVDPEGDLGWFTGLRYGVWGSWSRQAIVLRELIALAAYKLCGWA
jgi:uncharacterized SAM-binding protein YcdF (DUF218 family)